MRATGAHRHRARLGAGLGVAALVLVACGPPAEEKGGGPYGVIKRARDPETKMTFRLEGDALTVGLPPGAPRRSKRLIRGRLRFFCGPPKYYATPYAPVPQTTGAFPPGAREVTVRLGGLGGVSREAGFCGVEGPAGEAFGLFMPPSELLCAVAHERAEDTPEGLRKANATCLELRRRPPERDTGR
jgi:hypothetical protein